MSPSLIRPIPGVLLALASTAAMGAPGSNFSALTLFLLVILFWVWDRHSRISVGFVWGTPRSFLAALWPLLVVVALVFGKHHHLG